MMGVHTLCFCTLEKFEACLCIENIGQMNPKEEVFCSTLTLHSLLDPPGDIPDDLRDNIILGFAGICSRVRNEGKISRKLVECINRYLLEDIPNFGGKSLEIHQAVNHFVFWIMKNKLHLLSGPLYEVGNGWHAIWSCLMRGLPTFCSVTSIVDAAFMLLRSIMFYL